MINKDEILRYLRKIKPKLQQDGIINLGLFGSYAKSSADLASDIDIVIETTQNFRDKFVGFEAIVYLENLRQDLNMHFHKNIDFCNIAGLKDEKSKNYILDEVIYV